MQQSFIFIRTGRLFFIVAFTFSCLLLKAQYPQTGQEPPLSRKQITAVAHEAKRYSKKLNDKTRKLLSKMEKQELKLCKQRYAGNTDSAKIACSCIAKEYNVLNEMLAAGGTGANKLTGAYLPALDSLSTGFAFLNAAGNGSPGTNKSGLISGAAKNIDALQGSFNVSDKVQQLLKQRKQLLEQQWQSLELSKQFKKIKQQLYYYQQQVAVYKEALNNPSRLRGKIFEALQRVPAFSKFFREHSQLAAVFQLPGAALPVPQVNGLQTRTSVISQITNALGTGANVQQALGQNLNAAQAQLNQLKQQLSKLGNGGNSDMEMPDFKPNNQKTKSFFQRMETGFNLQSQRSSTMFPAASNIGISVGYKLNNKSIAGAGLAYKLGLGKNINHIRLTHEGLSLRSFIDYKLKGKLWLTGGVEYNYNSNFKNIEQLKNYSGWQQSILFGLSKKIAVGSKTKMNMQLLFDGMYRKNTPETKPLLFRVGYSL